MLHQPLGASGLSVSVLGFGAGHIGRSWQEQSDADAVLDAALGAGITFIDTARGYEYSPGVSTAIVGTSRPANLAAAAAAVERGPLPEAEVRRWEDAFAPHAGEWPGEV